MKSPGPSGANPEPFRSFNFPRVRLPTPHIIKRVCPTFANSWKQEQLGT